MSYSSMYPLGKIEHLALRGYLADPELEMASGRLTLLLSFFALLSSWTQHPPFSQPVPSALPDAGAR